MEVIRGTSGAVVSLMSGIAAKTASEGPPRDRLKLQSEFMRRVGTDVFPRVHSSTPGGYMMERLEPLEWTPERRVGGVFQEATDLLNAYVWGRTRIRPLSAVLRRPHAEYVKSLAERWVPSVAEWFEQSLEAIAYLAVTVTDDIHGDPTCDNMLQREDGSLALIDPIPADDRIPALKAADLGKMLQSAGGYERVKYGDYPLDPDTHDRVLDGVSPADAVAARYFHAVHLLRLIPYQPQGRAQIFMWKLAHMAGVGVV